ncbi:MAG TPA: methyltransferase domain-containing protein [Aeromicrobium sp.]|nr:methyltransferase domain-containing protein [Aeromicrobium sp.]
MGPVRAEVMWQAVVDAVDAAGGANSALNIVDLGGGTGRAAVRLAEAGHRVRVVDPSPDALASLHRRAAESDVGESVIGILGDAEDLADHIEAGSVDLVLCHGVLEVVDDPGEALSAMARALHPGGFASVVVAGRLAAVLARALAGDFARADALFRVTAASWDVRNDGPRRYLGEEIASLLEAAGFRIEHTNALRVFVDLVPSAMVDSEPGARDRLYALEQLVKQSADFAPIAAGLQTIARLD